MIYSYELEKKVLSGLLQHQHKWAEVSTLIKENDFYNEDSKVNISIFKLIRNALDNKESIDETILVQRLLQLKVSFPDSIDITEYIYSLVFFKISEDVFFTSLRELKKFTARREIYKSCKEVASFVKNADPNLKYSEIVDKADVNYPLGGINHFHKVNEANREGVKRHGRIRFVKK
jgi:replicative DNA helicase